MSTLWEQRFAQRTQRLKSSVIRELLKFTQQPSIISFAGGLPAPEYFPIARFEEASARVLSLQGVAALQYGPTEGYLPLRQLIAEQMVGQGIKVTPDNVLITSGSQQALDLIGKLFINPGDCLLVEQPTYLGALQAFNAYQACYYAVPMDDEGMITAHLEEELRVGPKFIYALPNFQNPSGATMTLERRTELLRKAGDYGVPVIEDDPYGQLRFEGENLPALAALDAQMASGHSDGYTGDVIYLSTFSKLLAPGLRVAWVVAPRAVINRLVQLKQGTDLHTSTFTQMMVYEAAKDGFLEEHVQLLRQVYRERRDVMLAALDREFPPEAVWTQPQGGLFLWVRLPDSVDIDTLFHAAVEDEVAFVPGHAFYVEGVGQPAMRLNFSNAQPEQIEEGIRRLGRAIKRVLGEAQPVLTPV